MNRKELYNLVKSLKENQFIFEKEAEAFKSIISKSNNDELEILHDTIMEAAEQSTGLRSDIQKIAEVIYPTFKTEKEAAEFVKQNLSLDILTLEGFDVFSILDKRSMYGISADEYDNHRVFHIIVKVEYSGEVFGFGYNEAHGYMSYTIDGSKPDFSEVHSYDYDKRIDLIKNEIEYTLGTI